ncbi:MAG TPA: nucleoside deaminase [Terriglobales bacterium]|nr:nucleoside deaminase [Terriglobales bacterium]
MQTPEDYMWRCIELARMARQAGDTPVGSLIVRDAKVIAEGIEAIKARRDITAHAEIEAIRNACQALGSLDLRGCILYTTAEPCWMCSYAIRHTGVSGVVIGAPVASVGGVSSRHPILTDSALECWPTAPAVTCGILRAECQSLKREQTTT